MGKKAKKQFNVRLGEAVLYAIQELAERWECSQAEVVERLVEKEPIPLREGTIELLGMEEGETDWRIEGVGNARPADDPNEFVVEPFDGQATGKAVESGLDTVMFKVASPRAYKSPLLKPSEKKR